MEEVKDEKAETSGESRGICEEGEERRNINRGREETVKQAGDVEGA